MCARTPRSGTDVPDGFELDAIAAWNDEGSPGHYAFTTFEGEPALRYASVLLAERNCLNCHGEPAGGARRGGIYQRRHGLWRLGGAYQHRYSHDGL